MFIDTLHPAQPVKTWIVNSGGGAIGLWQWELLMKIHSQYDVSGVCGTSAGTLNSFGYAKGILAEMNTMYFDVFRNNASKVFKPGIAQIKNGHLKTNFLKAIPQFLFNKNKIQGLMSNQPLIDTLTELDKLGNGYIKNMFFNYISLVTGDNVECDVLDFDDPTERIKGIVASTTIPGILAPISSVRTKTTTHKLCVDAGVRQGSPISQMFDKMKIEDNNRIIVLNCNRMLMDEATELKNAVDYLGRTAEIMLNENLRNDVAGILDKNNEAKKYGETIGRKYVPIYLVEYSGNEGVFSFTPESYENQKESARKDFAKLKIMSENPEL